MNIKRLTLGELGTNCYIVSKDGKALVIDPADDAETISDYLIENDLNLEGILLTHGHYDHIMASGELRRLTGAKIYAHEMEKDTLENAELNAGERMGHSYTVSPDVLLKDGEVVSFTPAAFKVIYTPGHTIGSACYLDEEEKIMFTGDTIFYGSVGRCDLPTGDEEALMASLAKLKAIDPDTEIYPGHGRGSTIAGELKRNIYLR